MNTETGHYGAGRGWTVTVNTETGHYRAGRGWTWNRTQKTLKIVTTTLSRPGMN